MQVIHNLLCFHPTGFISLVQTIKFGLPYCSVTSSNYIICQGKTQTQFNATATLLSLQETECLCINENVTRLTDFRNSPKIHWLYFNLFPRLWRESRDDFYYSKTKQVFRLRQNVRPSCNISTSLCLPTVFKNSGNFTPSKFIVKCKSQNQEVGQQQNTVVSFRSCVNVIDISKF